MRKITKGQEPELLTQWKRKHPNSLYADLSTDVLGVRLAIRLACLAEQYHLCAYCCKEVGIKQDDCMNEHILSRQAYPQKSLDFNNIVSSCTSKSSCDKAKGSQYLPISPLDNRCEKELKFNLNGTVQGLSADAKESIAVLNLGDTRQSNTVLVEARKRAVENYLFSQGVGIDDLFDDRELASLLIEELQQPKEGRLTTFAPIVAQVLTDFIGV